MAKKKPEKKENPLLIGIFLIVFGVLSFVLLPDRYDLVLFHVLTIPGTIAYRVIGVVLAGGGIFKIVDWSKGKKAQKDAASEAKE